MRYFDFLEWQKLGYNEVIGEYKKWIICWIQFISVHILISNFLGILFRSSFVESKSTM